MRSPSRPKDSYLELMRHVHRTHRDWVLKDSPLFQSAKDSTKRQTSWASRRDDQVSSFLSLIIHGTSHLIRQFEPLQGQRRAFVFAKIATTDDKSKATKSAKTLESVGTISLQIRRIKDVRDIRITKGEQQKRSAAKSAPSKPKKEKLIDEQTKKASTLLAASRFVSSPSIFFKQ